MQARFDDVVATFMERISRGPKSVNGTQARMIEIYLIMGLKAWPIADHFRDAVEKKADLRLQMLFTGYYEKCQVTAAEEAKDEDFEEVLVEKLQQIIEELIVDQEELFNMLDTNDVYHKKRIAATNAVLTSQFMHDALQPDV